MTYKICFLFIFVFHFISIGQNTYSDIVKPRLSFVSNKSESTDSSKIVVLNNDTLYAKYDTYGDLSFLKDTSYSDKKIIRDYQNSLFRYSHENSKNVIILKQWNSPIVIYLDKELPKKVRKQFESFFSQVKGIDNLNISFTKDIEKANYYIKVVDEPVNGYKDDYEFESEEERNEFVFTGANYNLLTDNNAKFYSGILEINPESKDEFQMLKQLKQLFFFSLGQFTLNYYSSQENRLRSDSYNNSEHISDYDLDLLRIHYKIIYDRKINGTTFQNLMKIAKDQI